MQLPGIPSLADWTDPHRAFTPGALFERDGGTATISVHRLGDLVVPTGAIVACDPLAFPDRPAFSRRVSPGSYPVEVSVARMRNGDERITCARLRLKEAEPVRWEIATIAGQDRASPKEGEIFGYPVDAGVGCFMDARTAGLLLKACDRLKPHENYYDDVLAAEMEANDRPTWGYANHRPDPTRNDNALVFSSGWGDGYYASVWGFDSAGDVTCLLTDFSTL